MAPPHDNENKHIGSRLDDFLAEEGILEEANAVAAERIKQMQDYTHEIPGMFFTIIHPETGDDEVRLGLTPTYPANESIGNRVLAFTSKNFSVHATIGQQQLGELGALFLTLAGKGFDHDSAFSLLDGFGVSSDSLMENAGKLVGIGLTLPEQDDNDD